MKPITVHLPQEIFDGLEELIRLQKYPNKPELIRVAIRDLLKTELWSKEK